MKSFFYFIGGAKDGDAYSGRLVARDEIIKVPKLKPQESCLLTDETEISKQDFTFYKCEVFDGRFFFDRHISGKRRGDRES